MPGGNCLLRLRPAVTGVALLAVVALLSGAAAAPPVAARAPSPQGDEDLCAIFPRVQGFSVFDETEAGVCIASYDFGTLSIARLDSTEEAGNFVQWHWLRNDPEAQIIGDYGDGGFEVPEDYDRFIDDAGALTTPPGCISLDTWDCPHGYVLDFSHGCYEVDGEAFAETGRDVMPVPGAAAAMREVMRQIDKTLDSLPPCPAVVTGTGAPTQVPAAPTVPPPTQAPAPVPTYAPPPSVAGTRRLLNGTPNPPPPQPGPVAAAAAAGSVVLGVLVGLGQLVTSGASTAVSALGAAASSATGTATAGAATASAATSATSSGAAGSGQVGVAEAKPREPWLPPTEFPDVPEAGWKCARCGKENDRANRFCGGCGAPRTVAAPQPARPWFCTRCGRRNEPAHRFCTGCGRAKGV